MKRKPLIIFLILALLIPFTFGFSIWGENDVYMPVSTTAEVLNVVIPSKVMFTIDPFEIKGRGQIYSDIYTIENRGNTSVFLTFSDIGIMFNGAGDFVPLTSPFDTSSESGSKSIYLALDLGDGAMASIIFTDYASYREIVIELAPGEILPMSFSGNVNHAPATPWNAGDISISLDYSLAYGSETQSDEWGYYPNIQQVNEPMIYPENEYIESDIYVTDKVEENNIDIVEETDETEQTDEIATTEYRYTDEFDRMANTTESAEYVDDTHNTDAYIGEELVLPEYDYYDYNYEHETEGY